MDTDNIYSLLYYSECASIIDMYNVFIKVCTRVLVDEELNDEMRKQIINILLKVKSIDDVVLCKLKHFVNDNEEVELDHLDPQIFEIGNLYTEGQYDSVIEKTTNLFDLMSNCFEIYEYYVKAHILSNRSLEILCENTIRQDLINAMYIAYLKVGDVANSYKELCRIERIFTNSYFGTGIASFFVDKYMIGESSIQVKAKEFMAPFLNVRYTYLFQKREIFSWLEHRLGNGSSLELLKKIELRETIKSGTKIEASRYRWYDIKYKSNHLEKEELLDAWYTEIKDKTEDIYKYQIERISTELFYLYLEQKKILNAEQLYVSSRIKNIYSVLRMDLDEIYNAITMSDYSIKKSICTPIIAYINNKTDYAQIFSHTANFMEQNDLEKPSDILNKSFCYEKNELIFFLKNVCTYEVLDSMYFVFEDEEEVENERIKICQFLQQFDADNKADYISEISQILKNRKIMQGIKYIEDVKIDLDMKKIIEQHLNVFEDNLKRFQEIGNLTVEYKAIDLENNLVYIKSNFDSKRYNHKLIIFREMLMDFRYELAFGKYGLDQTLGTRIRHGSMQNQLRAVFEKNNIIFVKRNTNDLSYSPSNSFSKICENLSDSDKEELFQCISNFSERVDKYINELRINNVKIKTEDINKDGLIDFTIKIDELITLFEETQKLNSEKIVLDLFENFWVEKIKQQLEMTRYFFSNNVKDNFIILLKELEDELHQINQISSLKYNLFDAISRSRTQIQNSIDIVAAWFKLPIKQEYSAFEFPILVETCEMINKQVFPKYSLADFKKEIDSKIKIKGKYFSYFIDILIIIFTNAYTHSGYGDDIEEFQLKIDIMENDGYIIMEICNNIAEKVDKEEINRKIKEINSKIRDILQTGQYSSFEGGSGFIKICKILEWNICVPWKMEFGLIDDETQFYTKVCLEIKSICEKGEA